MPRVRHDSNPAADPTSPALAALAGVVAVLAICVASLASAETTVLLIGDSITAGVVSGSAPGPAYPEVLQDALGAEYRVVARGCSGSSTQDWVPDSERPFSGCGYNPHYAELAVPQLPVDFAVVMLGTNDAFGFLEIQPVAPTSYYEGMDQIASSLLADGAKRVVIMSSPGLCEGINEAAQSRLTWYSVLNRVVCENSPSTFCGPNLFTLLDADLDFAACDVHPNARGHDAIGQALADVIVQANRKIECGLGGEASLAVLALWVRRRRGAGSTAPIPSS